MNQIIAKYLAAGLSLIPVGPDKRPRLASWDEFKLTLPTEVVADVWEPPIGVICGAVSGGLVCLDFDDGGSQFAPWGKRVTEELPKLRNRFLIQRTPSGGWHVIFRCPGFDVRNRKLARKPNNEVLIETRGEGGYYVAYPSNGYTMQRGDMAAPPVYTEEEAEALIRIAIELDQAPPPPERLHEAPVSAGSPRVGLTPFDDYNSRETPIPELEAIGWKVVKKVGQTTYLRRPGKDTGISASWNYKPGRFQVFSTSTTFSTEVSYSASGVYSFLHHNDNSSEAAKALYARGYGQRMESVVPTIGKRLVLPTPEGTVIPQSSRARATRVADHYDTIANYYTNGTEDNGVSSGWDCLNHLYRPAKSQLTVITGIPGHGKSEWLDAMAVNTALGPAQWRWAFFSPENYPVQYHLRKMAEKIVGKPFSGPDKMCLDELMAAMRWLDEHMLIISQSIDGTRLIDILETCREQLELFGPDALVLDPWNEILHDIGDDSETNYIGRQISLLRNFGRMNNLAVFVVAHPTKMHKERETQKYQPPTPYDISGSAHWYNKADNCITVFRTDNDETSIFVNKVKFKMYGQRGQITLLYDKVTGRYMETRRVLV